MPSIPNALVTSAPNVRIRVFERGELSQLLKIFAEALPRDQLSRSIYAAPRVEAFLSRLLDHPTFHAHEQLWGVEWEDKGFVGAAHTRLIAECHHLNNYAVLPSFQRQGLGSRMMAHWQSLARLQHVRRLSLDVTLENDGARRHYARFGFVDETRSYEYRLEGAPDLPDATSVHLIDWPLASASFEAYGFGRFVLALGQERYSVDLRVGEFRLGSCDGRLLAALQAMDPERGILVRTSDPLENPAWAYTGTILHMTKEMS